MKLIKKSYTSDARIRMEFSVDSSGKRQGMYTEYYPLGHVRCTGFYVDNKETGLRTRYYNTGGKIFCQNIWIADRAFGEALEYTQGGEMTRHFYVDSKRIDDDVKKALGIQDLNEMTSEDFMAFKLKFDLPIISEKATA